MRILITGGAGFIGSAAVRHFVAQKDVEVINVDKLTYAGDLSSLASIDGTPNYRFEHLDICNAVEMGRVFRRHEPDAVVNLAAETHVDRSIDSGAEFIHTNIQGTFVLLEAARQYWRDLDDARKSRFRFHQVSTDEVYGTLGPTGAFTEQTAYAPNSPYAASKAAADHLVRAWFNTYGLPVVTSNCSNNYGPYQFPEKLIPLTIINAVESRPIRVYGRGENVRDWIHVDDHIAALELVLRQGRPGECYNIGGGAEVRNVDVVRAICAIMDETAPKSRPHSELIEFVVDRPGHDFRYAIDASKIARDLGWRPATAFEAGLRQTVAWYLSNRDWWEHIRAKIYQGERLGTAGLEAVV
jgi:dTDP-glucose 4,6-dehydratase